MTLKQIIALDPGLRTFMTGYDGENITFIGDKCADKIYALHLLLDKLIIEKEMSDDEKNKIYETRQIIRKRISDMVDDLQWKIIKFLTSNYKTIIYPDFRTQGMMKKLSKENKRKLSSLAFYKFKQRLIYKCKVNKITLIITNEAYTSRTCTCCGHLNDKNQSKILTCSNCKITLDRDIIGSRNILIKTMSIFSGEK